MENVVGMSSLQVRPRHRSFTLPVVEGPGKVVGKGDRVSNPSRKAHCWPEQPLIVQYRRSCQR